MLVRLTRKYAECLDGVDLSECRAGQVLDLSERDAKLLIAEGWAKPATEESARAPGDGTMHKATMHKTTKHRATKSVW
jgi:hypothetical protein